MARKKPEAVRAVPVDRARKLVTIGPEPWPKAVADCAGAIVRIVPPATALDGEIEDLLGSALANGAARAFVLPRPKAEAVPQAAKEAPSHAVGARAAVLELVEESASKDKPALREFCEGIMARAGL